MKPKENAGDKAARLRERRITDVERKSTTEKASQSLTTDLQAIYGRRGSSLFGSGPMMAKPGK